MPTEEEKYKAETFKIIGIAMLTPIGPVFLTPIALFKQLGQPGFIVYFTVSFISLITGGMMIETGRRFIDKKEARRKWDQMI